MNFLNRKPREIGRLRTDYSPPEAKAVDAIIDRMKAAPLDDEDAILVGEDGRITKLPPPPREIALLEELAVILRRLTWSQMTEFGTGISADPKNIHEWSNR